MSGNSDSLMKFSVTVEDVPNRMFQMSVCLRDFSEKKATAVPFPYARADPVPVILRARAFDDSHGVSQNSRSFDRKCKGSDNRRKKDAAELPEDNEDWLPRKTAQAAEQLSPCATTPEPALWSPETQPPDHVPQLRSPHCPERMPPDRSPLYSSGGPLLAATGEKPRSSKTQHRKK
ncbi:hypothetical protein MG293_009888 [Ovis ammon polii]|uniref:Uncharacterized protein n=1 Tax=Ovis ammon polii TaxID=230172 RepID=A0AAD4U9Y9_OVIAM|nr:hypothetical protein MG293_009888 [Ovis ammon polii]